jgi:Domain of unknown function (DUF397)
MASPDLRRAAWRTSSYSANGSTCVEVAGNLPGIIAVRDSQHPHGPVLVFSPGHWRAFTTAIKFGTFSQR